MAVLMTDESTDSVFTLWIDADACPSLVRGVVYKAAKRMNCRVTVVANQPMYVPVSPRIRQITVASGANEADDRIVDWMQPGDIVITSDIPLAARVVDKEGIAIGHRGEVFDDDSVHSRLATRDMMEQFRAAGMDTGGPRPFDQKDVQQFANALDRTLLAQIRKRERAQQKKTAKHPADPRD